MKKSRKCKLLLLLILITPFFQIIILYSQKNVICLSNFTTLQQNINLKSAAILNGPEAQYLIITHDNFKDDILPLAQSKVAKALDTKIVTLSVIGSSTSQGIFNYIRNCYQSWPNLEYVLLVGDTEFVPTHYITDNRATDLYYGTMDSSTIGNDIFQEVFIGRLPAKTSLDVEIMVNKILHFESTYDPSDDWTNDILLAAQDDPNRPWLATQNEIADKLAPKGFDCTKVYAGGSSTGTSQDVFDAINDDVILINHRNHGSTSGWGTPSFKISNIDGDLDNNDQYPVMFSFNCLTGKFDGSSDCFGEVLMKTPNKGVVAFVGATEVSYSYYNDALDLGMFDSIWPDFYPNYTNSYGPATNLGKALAYGKQHMYDTYNPSKTTFELFNLLGDPEFSFIDVIKPTTLIQSPIDHTFIPLLIGVACAGALGMTLIVTNKYHKRNIHKPKSKYKSKVKPTNSNYNNVRTYQNSSHKRTPLRNLETSRKKHILPTQQYIRGSNSSMSRQTHRSPRQNYTYTSRRDYSTPPTKKRSTTAPAQHARYFTPKPKISQYRGLNAKEYTNKRTFQKSIKKKIDPKLKDD